MEIAKKLSIIFIGLGMVQSIACLCNNPYETNAAKLFYENINRFQNSSEGHSVKVSILESNVPLIVLHQLNERKICPVKYPIPRNGYCKNDLIVNYQGEFLKKMKNCYTYLCANGRKATICGHILDPTKNTCCAYTMMDWDNHDPKLPSVIEATKLPFYTNRGLQEYLRSKGNYENYSKYADD